MSPHKTVRLWPATKPVGIARPVPGSKSITNRALVLAALAPGVSELHKVSLSNDSRFLIAALKNLGVRVDCQDDVARVHGKGTSFDPYRGTVDVGAGGTTIRFILPLCALAHGAEIVLEGTERLHERPIGDLVGALNALGADIQYQGRFGCPPLLVKGSDRLAGGSVSIGGSVSSQFLSSLLMIGPALPKGLTVKVQGEQVSKPYVDMTLALMGAFGVEVQREGYDTFSIPPGCQYSPSTYRVEGDASGATYLWGLAAVSGGQVRVRNIALKSVQGDMRFTNVLESMGCAVIRGSDDHGDYVEVQGPKDLRSVEVDLEDMPDTAQTLAVVAACAKGTSVLTGLQTLRVKETDRIEALVTELGKVGIRAESGPDSLVVHGGSPSAARIATYEDHRMAMSFALLGSVTPGIVIEDPAVVQKSFPDFWDTLESCGVRVEWQDGSSA